MAELALVILSTGQQRFSEQHKETAQEIKR